MNVPNLYSLFEKAGGNVGKLIDEYEKTNEFKEMSPEVRERYDTVSTMLKARIKAAEYKDKYGRKVGDN